MEDLRKKKIQDQINRSYMINNILTFIKNNYIIILIFLFVIFLFSQPNLLGEYIGWWVNSFTNSLTKNLIN